MKNLIINSSMALIKNSSINYSEEKLEEIKYGLLCLYLEITKIVFIFVLSFFLGIFKEMFLFLLSYNIIRTFSFGLHATKSWICWVSSTLVFIGIPYLCILLEISFYIKVIIGIIGILLIYKNSPADTKKKPIISLKRRKFFKFISTIIAIIYIFVSIIIENNLLSNILLFSIVLQCALISPFVYKIFGLSYDNYKNYIKV